jgi:hypothetical protein
MTNDQINALHTKAMDFAGRAVQAELKADYGAAKRLFRRAFDLERQAAEAVAPYTDAEPSRSVLLRSAASLALDCQEFREAERLVAFALTGNPPVSICEELRDLLEKVYFSRHLDLRGLKLDPIEFQMTMVGGAVGFGIMESTQFLRRADTLDRLLVRTIERKRGMAFRDSRAPSKETTKDFEVYFSTSRAASYAITVRLGKRNQQLLIRYPEEVQPEHVVIEILDCLKDFADGRVEALRERIPDESYYNNFTALAKKMAPDGQKIRSVGFTSLKGNEKHMVALTSPPSDIWTPKQAPGTTEEYVGRIRAADETSERKRPVFRVEDATGNVSPTIQVPSGMLQDIVKPYWGELVRVLATKPKRGGLRMLEIKPVEGE